MVLQQDQTDQLSGGALSTEAAMSSGEAGEDPLESGDLTGPGEMNWVSLQKVKEEDIEVTT